MDRDHSVVLAFVDPGLVQPSKHDPEQPGTMYSLPADTQSQE